MTEPFEVDPIIPKLIQSIEEKDDATRELKGRVDGVATVLRFMIENINGNIISGQMKLGSNNYNSFETKLYKIVIRIDMLETKIMYLLSNI